MKNAKLFLAFLISGLLVGIIMTSALAQQQSQQSGGNKPPTLRRYKHNEHHGVSLRYYEDRQAGLCFAEMYSSSAGGGSFMVVPCSAEIRSAAGKLIDEK
jgi:hypothetical protein